MKSPVALWALVTLIKYKYTVHIDYTYNVHNNYIILYAIFVTIASDKNIFCVNVNDIIYWYQNLSNIHFTMTDNSQMYFYSY